MSDSEIILAPVSPMARWSSTGYRPSASLPLETLLEVVQQQITLFTFDAGDGELVDRLVEGVGADREPLRTQLIATLGEIGDDLTPALTAALLNHANPLVRQGCAKALAKIGDPEAVPSLIQALRTDRDPVTQSSAAAALARIGGDAVSALLELMGSEAPEAAKGQAVWALTNGGDEAAAQIYQAARSDRAEFRAAVMPALQHLAQATQAPEAFAALLQGLADESVGVRSAAANALGQLRHGPATAALLGLLRDPEGSVRRSATLALGKIAPGDPAILAALQVGLTDSQESVQAVTKLAIAQIQMQIGSANSSSSSAN
jgi:bilin biosynthesis protein